MIIDDVSKLKNGSNNKVKCKCDNCEIEFIRRFVDITRSRDKRKSNKDHCHSCSALLRPLYLSQHSEYWTEERKRKLSDNIKNSEIYKKGIKNRKSIFGKDNPMFGKKHTLEARDKMSKSQKKSKRTGSNSPSWRGGRRTLNQAIRAILHSRFNWYYLIYKRDNFKCSKCSSKKKLDAHHIIPLSDIINKLLKDNGRDYSLDNLEWLCNKKEISDNELKNGITLCRACHKKEHKNWGSHNAKVK